MKVGLGLAGKLWLAEWNRAFVYEGSQPKLFKTRRECKQWINANNDVWIDWAEMPMMPIRMKNIPQPVRVKIERI